MKVLILTNDSTGLIKFRRELMERLIEEDYKVQVSVPEGILIEEIKSIGCKVILNGYLERRGTSIKKDWKLIRYYVRLLKQEKPDIVLTYTIKPNAYGGIACSLLGIPYIANITGLGTSIKNRGNLRFVALLLYRIGLKKAAKVFFQNRENQEYMHKKHIVTKEQSDIIPGSGVNIDKHCYEPYPGTKSPVVFTTIGRIMKDKGIHEILEAAEKTKKKYQDTVFRLIGDFDGNYSETIQEYERKNIITYIPQQPDIHPYIAESHAIIHASYHEGMSNVLLEAAATGRPVIATDVHGCIEAFEPEVTGIAFQAGDAAGLRIAIEKFLAMSNGEREAMGKAGREKMEKEFNRDIVVGKYMAEIERILKKGKHYHNYNEQ